MGIPYAEVIGDPIAHSKSPLIHKFWLEKLGIEGDYRATRVAPGGLRDYFRDRTADPDWRGCNISMPHKLAARAFARHRPDPSFPPWPINLAYRDPDRRLIGEEFDSAGFLKSVLKLRGEHSGPSSALVLGAGSTARLVAWGLAHFGCMPIWIWNRDEEKARAFAKDFARIGVQVLAPGTEAPTVDILVNATPLGMAGMPEVEIDLTPLPDHALICDLVYDPTETALLKQARARGLRAVNGLHMLVEQAAPSFHRLFGAMPPRALDGELWEALEA